MKYKLRLIMYTLVGYFLDILVWGGLIGLLNAILTYISSLFITIHNDLSFLELVLQGIVFYWVFDSISAKLREEFNDVKEWIRKEDN